jgi:hypothetical protein
METVVLVVVAMIVIAGGTWLVATSLRARAHELDIEREKLDAAAAGHREMVAAHESSVAELAPKAKAHRAAAADHARTASKLEQRIERERRHAKFHEQRAAETEQDRERI